MSEVAFLNRSEFEVKWEKSWPKWSEVEVKWNLVLGLIFMFLCPFVTCLVIKVAFGLYLLLLGWVRGFGAFWVALGHLRKFFICWEIWVFWAVSGYLDEIGAYWAVFGHLRQFGGILSLSKMSTEVLRTSVFWNFHRIEAEVDQKLTELKRSEALHSSLILTQESILPTLCVRVVYFKHPRFPSSQAMQVEANVPLVCQSFRSQYSAGLCRTHGHPIDFPPPLFFELSCFRLFEPLD